MLVKLLITVAFFSSMVNCGVVVPAAAPITVGPASLAVEEYDLRPQYKYGYDVQDALSGDTKDHVEEREGEVVRGQYSLVDPDGFRRVVTYTADPVNGFNAVVRREPLVAPVVAATPVVEVGSPAVPISPPAPSLAYRRL